MARTAAPKTTQELYDEAFVYLEASLTKLETAATAVRKAIKRIKIAQRQEAQKAPAA